MRAVRCILGQMESQKHDVGKVEQGMEQITSGGPCKQCRGLVCVVLPSGAHIQMQ